MENQQLAILGRGGPPLCCDRQPGTAGPAQHLQQGDGGQRAAGVDVGRLEALLQRVVHLGRGRVGANGRKASQNATGNAIVSNHTYIRTSSRAVCHASPRIDAQNYLLSDLIW